jgi:hypothetical protein
VVGALFVELGAVTPTVVALDGVGVRLVEDVDSLGPDFPRDTAGATATSIGLVGSLVI